MNPETRNSAIAAAAFLTVFGLAAFYLPDVMKFVGERSTVAAGAVAICFVLAFFLFFWLRARHRKGD
jgi:TM2 domain-containing membrane protein YozV